MNKFFLAFVLLSYGSAFACSCQDGYGPASLVLKESDSLFLGIPATTSKKVSGQKLLTKFTVLKNFKNAGTPTKDIYSDIDDGGNCGIDFVKEDAVYLIDAYKTAKGNYITSVCSVSSVDYEDKALTKLINDLTLLTTR